MMLDRRSKIVLKPVFSFPEPANRVRVISGHSAPRVKEHTQTPVSGPSPQESPRPPAPSTFPWHGKPPEAQRA